MAEGTDTDSYGHDSDAAAWNTHTHTKIENKKKIHRQAGRHNLNLGRRHGSRMNPILFSPRKIIAVASSLSSAPPPAAPLHSDR